jgi:hypothetical protein
VTKSESSFHEVERCFPHVASIMYFRTPPKSHPPCSFRDSIIGLTPRKMAAGGRDTPERPSNRRRSSIPRPTSKLKASRTTPLPTAGAATLSGNATVKANPQTVVKPRTYSRTRQTSYVPRQNDPPYSCKVPRTQPPRLSLPSQLTDGSNDLSGIRQQLPVRHYSRHSLASLDAMVSSAAKKDENKTTTSLRLPSHQTKGNTTAFVAKVTSPVIPQRQLMGPIGPPMPRSQTMGNISCFASPSLPTPSPTKSTTRTISTISQRSDVDFKNALAESRMTDKEIEYFNQVAREVEANKRRIKSRRGANAGSSENTSTSLSSSKTLSSFMKSNRSSDQLFDASGGLMISDSSSRAPFKGAKLETTFASNPPTPKTILTPDSGVSMGSAGEADWEINVRLVS